MFCSGPRPSGACKILGEPESKEQKSLQSPNFISTLFSTPVNNPAALTAAKHIHPSFLSESLPSEGAFQRGYKPAD